MVGAWVALLFAPRRAGAQATSSHALPYPRVTVRGEVAYDEWRRLRDKSDGWPVIIGGDDALALIAEQFDAEGEPVQEPAAILAAATRIEAPAASLKKQREDDEKEFGDPAFAGWLPEVGDWPEPGAAEVIGLTVNKDILTGKYLERVHILILPTRDGAEVPAYLRWGSWNDCPSPAIHVAMLRDWNRRYGAEVVGLSGDTLNLRVAKRPTSRDEALALAHEQYFYCEDLIVQGTETFGALAGALMVSDWWFFWWD